MAVFCTNCGAPLADNAKFCTKCGTPTELKKDMPEQEANFEPEVADNSAEEPTTEENVYQTIEAEQDNTQSYETAANEDAAESYSADSYTYDNDALGEEEETYVEMPKIGVGKTIFSVILSVLAFVLLTAAGLTLVLKLSLSPKSVEKTVKNIDISAIDVSTVLGEKKSITLADYLYDHKLSIADGTKNKIELFDFDKKNLKKALNEDFVKVFITSKANEYISDIESGKTDAAITIDEILDVADENWDTICEDLDLTMPKVVVLNGFDLETKDLDIIELFRLGLNKNVQGSLDNLALKNIEKKNSTVFDIAKLMLSYVVIGAMGGVGLLLLIIVVILNIKCRGGFKYMGFTALFAGLIVLVAGVLMKLLLPGVLMKLLLPGLLNKSFALGVSTYSALFSQSWLLGVIIGGATVLYGAIFILIGTLLRKSFKKKYA